MRWLVAGLLLGLCSQMAGANAALSAPVIVWQGGITTVAATLPACTGVASVGDLNTAIFRPRLDPIEPASAISILTTRSAAIYARSAGAASDKMNGSGTYAGMLINERAGTRSFVGAFNFSLSPTNPVATSPFILVQGTISNYDGTAGCTVTIRGSFSRRP